MSEVSESGETTWAGARGLQTAASGGASFPLTVTDGPLTSERKTATGGSRDGSFQHLAGPAVHGRAGGRGRAVDGGVRPDPCPDRGRCDHGADPARHEHRHE